MNKVIYLLMISVLCFAERLNYAPKIENPIVQKPLVVVIPSYNNARFFNANLKSVVNQKYQNFRIIYTNDASTDRTGKLVQNYIEKHFDNDRFTYIENIRNKGALYNIYHMVHSCRDDEVICILDGDDKLSNDRVLERINQAYADDRVWMTYGLDECRINRGGHSSPTPFELLKTGRHRELTYRWSHLRTYYAGLFKSVPLEKWQYKNKFYPIAQDIAQVLFLMDLAREHVFFIPEVLYVYNVENPINDFKKNVKGQIYYRNYIWNLPPLKRLHSKKDFL